MANLKTYIVRGYEYPNTDRSCKFSEMVRAPSGSQARKAIRERYERPWEHGDEKPKIPIWILGAKLVDDG